MRRQKNEMQTLLIPGAIVSVAVFLFLLTSANSNQPSNSPVIQEKTNTVSGQTTSPVGTSPNAAPVNTSTSQNNPVSVAPIPPAQPTTPQPKALELLLPSEITSATPQGDGYVVTTSFGANWFLSQQEVESFPMSMKLRIDYGKYGAGANGAAHGN
ncbi:MAG: hypothetical protein WCA07_16640 [Gloeobacterales cyanobacterium]